MSIRVLKCTRCRAATQSNLLVPVLNEKLSKRGFKVSDNTCPKCGGASFYDVTPEIAWCWASGLIEWGEGPLPDGAIQIATGPSCDLKRLLGALARHGQGESAGKLLVPGIPEADGQKAAGDALGAWLKWCAKRRTKGVSWSVMNP